MKRNLNLSKIPLLSIILFLACFVPALKVQAQHTCGLSPRFQYQVDPQMHVNFQDVTIDSSYSGFTLIDNIYSPNNPKAPCGLITADFNMDGKLDLATADSGTGNICIALGNGSGGFATPVNFATGGTGTVTLVSGDFNGDNKLDLATVNSTSGNISIFLGNGNGTFTFNAKYGVGINPYSIVNADFNGDGIQDLAVSNTGSNSISVFLGNGDGTFTTGTSLLTGSGTGPKSITTADFNKDGKADLAAANFSSGTVGVFLGNGAGIFSAAPGSPFQTNLVDPWGIVSNDFNGDGAADIAVSDTRDNFVTVLLNKNDGTGNFNGSASYPIGGSEAHLLTCGDMDGNGSLDLLVSTSNQAYIIILYGNSDGTFSNPFSVSNVFHAYGTAIGDFDNDGHMDFAHSNYTGQLDVFLNQSKPVSIMWRWDFGDGDSSLIQNPSHTYAKDSTYNVCLMIVNSYGCVNRYCGPVSTGASVNCLLSANYSYSTDTTTELVSFTDLSTDNTSAASITSWHWDFGDGDSSNVQNPSHTFTAAGNYHVCLTITNSLGCTDEYCVQIAIFQPPQLWQISPANSIICSGGSKTLTVIGATGNNYQWQISPDNITWTNIPGATNTTYTTASADGTINEFYRLLAQSNVASATAEVDTSKPVITITVSNTTCQDVTLNWTPVGTGNYTIAYSGTSSSVQTSVTPPKTISGLAAGGTYNIVVTQTGIAGCTASGSTVINTAGKPIADYSYFLNDSTATFKDLSIDSTGTITSWSWEFGDGTSSTQQNPSHHYALGTYMACLTVTNSSGCSSQYCNPITITQNSNCKLSAQFSYTLNDTTGLALFQDLSADTSIGATINSWSWDFSTFNGTSSLQNPSFTFPVDSTYHVCLTVKNSIGCSSTTCRQIVFNKINPDCHVRALYSFDLDTAGSAVFQDLSYDSLTNTTTTITTWAWNFGDPSSPDNQSFQKNPTHVFTTSGNYNVCLTAGNASGCTNTWCFGVPVNVLVSTLCVTAYPQDSTLGSQPPQQTVIYLIQAFNTAGGDSLALVDSSTYNGQFANHCFNDIPNGTYYIKAAYTAQSSQYPNYFPTYFNSALLWSNATPLNLNGTQYVSVIMLKGSNSGGPGFIGGYVTQGANRLEQGSSANAYGDPIPGKLVLLMTAGGDPVAHTLTDAQGHYKFSNLAYGMYDLSLDELNKPCQLLPVMIDDSTGYLQDANFNVNSKSITSGIALKTLTVNKYPFAVKLLGSPVADELKLYMLNMSADASITITDLLGRKLVASNAAQESTLVNLNVQSLATGVYLVTVNSGSDVKTIKFVKE